MIRRTAVRTGSRNQETRHQPCVTLYGSDTVAVVRYVILACTRTMLHVSYLPEHRN
jgi:hypothetical protein